MRHHTAFRRKTRSKLRKGFKEKGKVSLRKFFQAFAEGDKVVLKAEPAHHKGMYFPRFHGKVGLVMSKRGNCYEILIQDGRKEKLVVVHPVHLMRADKK